MRRRSTSTIRGAFRRWSSKKLALAYPPAEQEPGRIVELRRAYAWLRFCREDRLQRRARAGIPRIRFSRPPTSRASSSCRSTERLDVTSVYTSTAVDEAGNPGPHSSIDVEQIEERATLGVDLQIDKNGRPCLPNPDRSPAYSRHPVHGRRRESRSLPARPMFA